jgi:hypothetical protein
MVRGCDSPIRYRGGVRKFQTVRQIARKPFVCRIFCTKPASTLVENALDALAAINCVGAQECLFCLNSSGVKLHPSIMVSG